MDYSSSLMQSLAALKGAQDSLRAALETEDSAEIVRHISVAGLFIAKASTDNFVAQQMVLLFGEDGPK